MRIPAAIALAAGLLAAGVVNQSPPPEQLPYRNPRLSTVERVRDLIARMTLEEKFWQLLMIPGDLDDPSHDYHNGVFGLQIATGALLSAASASLRDAPGRQTGRPVPSRAQLEWQREELAMFIWFEPTTLRQVRLTVDESVAPPEPMRIKLF